jgi:mono/diheme cytochrome c family protein
MRELLARALAVLTGLFVVALAAAFSLVQNGATGSRAPPPTPAEEAAGRAAYDELGCSGCHAIGGEGNPRSALDGVGARLAPGEIRAWIVASQEVRPRLSGAVARIKQTYATLPEERMNALVGYLASLRAVESHD